MKRVLLAAGALCALAVGCTAEALEDAPLGQLIGEPVDVIQMPDEFPNIAYLCTPYGDLIYATTRDNGQNLIVMEGGCDE